MFATLDALAEAAIAGRLISFPTDTVPALAARSDRAELVFAAKRRDRSKPLILMGANPSDLWTFVKGTDTDLDNWKAIADRYWPGAITFVLPASDRLPKEINPIDPTTVGLRIPDCTIARQLLEITGPLATTSANLSGEPPLENLAEIRDRFPEAMVLAPELAEPGSGQPSTVVKWTETGWKLLRQGGVLWHETI